MTQEELREIIEKHRKWLKSEKGGEQANLCGADLCGAYFVGADLGWASLCGANLNKADLCGVNLRGAHLYNTNFYGSDLFGTDLSGADLYAADFRGANIDYSCWPLWCGSFDVKVDARIARQLAYHFCRLDCDDPEYLAARKALAKFANGFHRVGDCGRIEV